MVTTMKKTLLLLLLSISGPGFNALADRPAMHERSQPAAEPVQLAEPIAAPATQAQSEAPVDEQSHNTSGDVLELQAGETLPVQLLDFPRRGMSMGRVQNELGRPVSISPTVGQPPITSWRYDDRKVYFEGDRVIHVVATQ